MGTPQDETQSNELNEQNLTEETTSQIEDVADMEDVADFGDDEATSVEEELQEDKDFTGFGKQELLDEIKKIVNSSDVVKAEKISKKIKEAFDPIVKEEEAAAKAEYLEANGNTDGFEYHNADIKSFNDAFYAIKNARRQHFEQMQKMREDNLKKKRAIINQVKELIESTDDKGVMSKVKDLQKDWKATGAVPQQYADEIYKTYGALLDRFYDQMSIEFELKELDRQHNLKAKKALIERAEKLLEVENISEAVVLLNNLHEEFRSIGPVPKDDRDSIWNAFKEISDKIYEKKRQYAEEFKQVLDQNMKLKQALCLKVEPFSTFDTDRIKEWNEETKSLLAVQKEWEAIGPVPREVASGINKQFWANFKQFFANKNKFFEVLEAQRAENLEKKKVLVAKAEKLKESSDWNATADALIALQKEWKSIGPVPEKFRDSVYAEFKAACDAFFERKRNKRNEENKEYAENLNKKEEIILELNKLTEDKTKFDQTLLDEKTEAFFAIGFVPRKEKDAIVDKFVAAVEAFVATAEELDEKGKLQALAGIFNKIPSGGRKFRNQEQNIRNKIKTHEDDIALWQNNLAFFANSKTADKLLSEYNEKIEASKAELKKLKDQLRVIQSIED
ncbi:DUF349 domain-containing protein [Flammeovirga yaeyamensis]|uniref:DUF349 domain-containing protein n=1 Tax=Flammeovirga yaeyamensis TaxID=367791 RepID=A0AAX1MYI5_9BACT|nr:DUF349 domain-containing protein [Flammeovirga yaeyamensis]MBB3696127.1 hypothetical protein [Flammeovirga yaeyamensis]NMF34811.1 DUF349 domain-containing protein [Flammeovirga yaeyamensis]QWG00361.1 DUF349 domain-containing protein [Flammeovirga yaeyamensis]